MDTFIFFLWTAFGAGIFIAYRLQKLTSANLPDGHWLTALIALGRIVMILAWARAALDFIRPDWPGAAAWISAAVYLALMALAIRALGPANDASPLLKRFHRSNAAALPAPVASSPAEKAELEA